MIAFEHVPFLFLIFCFENYIVPYSFWDILQGNKGGIAGLPFEFQRDGVIGKLRGQL